MTVSPVSGYTLVLSVGVRLCYVHFFWKYVLGCPGVWWVYLTFVFL